MDIGLILFFITVVSILFYVLVKRQQNADIMLLKRKYDIPRLLKLIESRANLNHRIQALKALAVLDLVDTTPALMRILLNYNLEIELRTEAAETLGRLGNPAAITCLLGAVESKHPILRDASKSSYDRMKDKLTNLMNDVLRVDVESKFRTSEKTFTGTFERVWREYVNNTLALGKEKQIEELIRLLVSINEITYESLTRLILQAGEKGRLPAIELVSKIDSLYEKTKLKNSTELMLKALKNQDDKVRASAAFALGIIKDEATLDSLEETLKDSSEGVCLAAVGALGEFKDERAFDILSIAVEKSWNIRRDALASAIGNTGNPRGVKVLLDMLHEDYAQARFEFPHDIDKFEPDREPETLSSIIEALRKIGTEEALYAISSRKKR
jgi:HEAT repeat protein